MPIWTKERKRRVLRELARVNEALDEALRAVRMRKTAEAAEHVLTAVARKHAAIDQFPPVEVSPGVTIAAGRIFRDWENRICL